MPNALVTYCHDHLAGARFAISLLEDLESQSICGEVAEAAANLKLAISQDQSVLQDFVNGLGADPAVLKEAAGWVAQKASRVKLNMEEPFGIFEAVEMLSLGVLGKRALWLSLRELQRERVLHCSLDLENLLERAEQQFEQLESLRRSLAIKALAGE